MNDERIVVAARRLLEDPHALTAGDVRLLTDLARRATSREWGEEVFSDLVAQCLARRAGGQEAPSPGQPVGYVVRMMRNRMLDIYRREYGRAGHIRHDIPWDDLLDHVGSVEPVSDDDIAARLDATADADVVRRGFRTAVARADQSVVRVITFSLDHIATLGEMPSTRLTGNELGLSHTAVANALSRFREYLAGLD
jgi:DNA-directed RNA polymerase specialized sigma24 family protein